MTRPSGKLLTASVSEPDLRTQSTCTAGMFRVRLADARGEELATALAQHTMSRDGASKMAPMLRSGVAAVEPVVAE